jgi:hypothetical protein
VPTTTIAKVPADYFEPPVTPARRRRRRRRRIAAVITTVVLVAAVGAAAVQYADHLCRGFALPDTRLTQVDDECVGWTIERPYRFTDELATVTTLIAEQNVSARKRAEDQRRGYVRIAVLMPLTASATSAMTLDTIRRGLEGVYVAQVRANNAVAGTASPYVQLVLMNEGRDQTHWPELIPVLRELKTGDHPVVSVVGLGVSIPPTQAVAVELSGLDLPAVGGVLTATDLEAPRLFEVSPSNKQYVNALVDYRRLHPRLKEALLVYDTNDDNYVRTLRDAFRQQFKLFIKNRQKGFIGSLGTTDAKAAVFDAIKTYVCASKVDMLLYAGRDRDLPTLIGQLAARSECYRRPPVDRLVILTGSTGLNLDKSIEREMVDSQITLIDASSSDPIAWQAGADAPAGFKSFRTEFLKYFPATDLLDGYALGHHDAVALVTEAIRNFAEQSPGSVVAGKDVHNQIINLNEADHPFQAASGDLIFDDEPGRWPHGKKIALIEVPAGNPPLPSFTTP